MQCSAGKDKSSLTGEKKFFVFAGSNAENLQVPELLQCIGCREFGGQSFKSFNGMRIEQLPVITKYTACGKPVFRTISHAKRQPAAVQAFF